MNYRPVNPQKWMDDAACIGTDPEEWFPGEGEHAFHAKRICNGTKNHPPCPVKNECLAFALSNEGLVGHGVWGGLSERERRKLKLKGRAA